ncbi:MAG: disulfide reductase [Chloroflexi bacterium CG_4_9_14_3_um_filter_45_9]|nr:MAG: disulfide reductase [Chloroflexi bacterium CG08_land_8_20_14_0_20_45_12]PIX27655.1 MAG: disulfide reductase [Chloroflexi bacterium CG_4_8_14_3_um_filter_45_15]PJB49486.1 MAG: disulfide reductase [Chloroflexi bacterium CG_4_9_14_3_um_filter_45_9]
MGEVRTGVYICHCGSNIAGKVDVAQVSQHAGSLDSVVVARDYKFMCSEPGQDMIKQDIKNLNLNRVVVASCSPKMHEPTFRKVCEQAGLNRYLFQMANIREHCSWVTDDRQKATEKTKSLVEAAVRRVYYHEPLEMREVPVNPSTLVVGAGIAGIQAALEIADSHHKVYLVEREPSIGGHMVQLDKTFPTLDCSACILTPKMSDVGSHPYIELLSYSEVEEVSGYVGNFKVKIKKKARYVDEEKCTGCGLCQTKCPWKVTSEFDMGLGQRKVIYTPFPQAVPNVPIIDRPNCVYFQKGKCRACEKFCEAGAIDFEQKDKLVEVEVGNIIIATGFQTLDPSAMPQYSYGKYDNIITGLEFERLCNATGPTGGNIQLKDGSTPRSVALIHCVGSRDKKYHDYCSRVCCMYALKHSHLIKEKTNAEVYQIFTDIRCFGKDYEDFYQRLVHEGVNFVRGKVQHITSTNGKEADKGRLTITAEDPDNGKVTQVVADMVVLCTAIEAQQDVEKVARTFSISRKADGFFLERHPKMDPVATMTDGIYIAGCCQGPKDIPDTVSQASAAAAQVLVLITKGKVELEANTAVIDEAHCSGCLTCNLLCPYSAITFDEKKKVSSINEALCKGCGVCVAACPSGAITGRHFTTQQIMAEIEGVLV